MQLPGMGNTPHPGTHERPKHEVKVGTCSDEFAVYSRADYGLTRGIGVDHSGWRDDAGNRVDGGAQCFSD